MLDILVKTARNKVQNFDVGGAIKLITDCLEGCSKEQALKIITGEYRLVEVEGGADFEEAEPDFDLNEWAEDVIEGLKNTKEDLIKDAEGMMNAIADSKLQVTVNFDYPLVFGYYFHKRTDELLESFEENDQVYLIKGFCRDARKFMEECHDAYCSIVSLRKSKVVSVNPEDLVRINSEINTLLNELCVGSSDVDSLFARRQYMLNELDKYMEGSKSIEEMYNSPIFQSIDITADVDAGWLSPEGFYYGLKGAVANMLHLAISDALRASHRIPLNDTPADVWMSSHGWVKIHHDEVYFDSCIDNIPLTDVQKDLIVQYGKEKYNGLLKFGGSKKECRVSKFQQMDDFAIKKLFDYA